MSRVEVAKLAIASTASRVEVAQVAVVAAAAASRVEVADLHVSAAESSRVEVAQVAVVAAAGGGVDSATRWLITARTATGTTRMRTRAGATPPPPTSYATDLSGAGALPIGTAVYPVPTGAVYMSTTGSDSTGNGSISAPYATLVKAQSMAPVGGTVVIRGGTYHEGTLSSDTGYYPLGASITTAGLTVQNHPGEAVWFDGAQTMTGWVADGSQWRLDGYAPNFPYDLSNSQNSADGSGNLGDGFTRADYPCAHMPDQLWIDGVALRQVESKALATSGKFYVDKAANQVWLGSNPTGKTVRMSTLSVFTYVIADNVTIRGIGVRGYAPSLAERVVNLNRAGGVLENCHVIESSTTGVGVYGRAGCAVRFCTITDHGNMGVNVSRADDTVVESNLIQRCNVEMFDAAPSAGGLKATKCQRLTVKRNRILDCPGSSSLWLDESCYDFKVLSNDLTGSDYSGLNIEISAKGIVADNVISGSGTQWHITGTDGVRAWCNTARREGTSGEVLVILQDNRTPNNTTYARDSRQPQSYYDTVMTWQIGALGVELGNNALLAQGIAPIRVKQYNYSALPTQPAKGTAAFNLRGAGNLINRPTSGSPSNLLEGWSSAVPGAQQGYASLATFRAAFPTIDATSVELTGSVGIGSDYRLTSAGLAAAVGQPLPADIADLIGKPAGTTKVGAFR